MVDGKVAGQTLDERLAEHAVRFDADTEWVYGLLSPDERTVLGAASLHPRIGPDAVEIGYWLAAGATGRGLATRAAAALTRVAFASSDIAHVEIRCDRRNVASGRVPARLGYRDTVMMATHGAADLVAWRLTRAEFERWSSATMPAT